MTLDEAQANIGKPVVYDPGHGPFEDGVIKSVNGQWVQVQYGQNVKATAPGNLYLADQYNPRDAWLDWKAGK